MAIGLFEVTGTPTTESTVVSQRSVPLEVNLLGIESARALDANTVELRFAAPLSQSTSKMTVNYAFDQGVNVEQALLAAGDTVVLTTGALVEGQEYVLTVNNVTSGQ